MPFYQKTQDALRFGTNLNPSMPCLTFQDEGSILVHGLPNLRATARRASSS